MTSVSIQSHEINAFVPYLFVGVGATSAFYTLRETYMHSVVIDGVPHKEVRSYHHFNLSQDADEAITKAQDYAERNMIELRSTREQLENDMREIKRANAEQLAAREAYYEQQAEYWTQYRLEWERLLREKVIAGEFANGPYCGKKFRDVPRGYISWVIKKGPEFDEGSLMRLTADELKKHCADLVLPEPSPTLTVGEPGQRLVFEATVIRSRFYKRLNDFNHREELVHITTMVDKTTGACLLVKSPKFNPLEGAEVRIKGTIKAHDDYKGQAQTVLQRVTKM
jgi:uncharacterized protein (DUF3820 family)